MALLSDTRITSKKFIAVAASWLLVSSYFPAIARADTSVYHNLGFLQGNIWYSKDPFYSGDQIRIYSAVFNSSPDDLLGTVQFYDNDQPIGSRFDFSVQGGGRIQDVWTDWTATPGDHKITAKILDAEIAPIGKTPQKISVVNEKTGESERQVAVPVPEQSTENSSGTTNTPGNSDNTSGSANNTATGSTVSITSMLPNDVARLMPQPVQKTIGIVEGAVDEAVDQAVNYLEDKKLEIEAAASNHGGTGETGSKNQIANGSSTARYGNTKESGIKKSGHENAPAGTSTEKTSVPLPKISVSGFWDETRILGINLALFILHRLWLVYLLILLLIFLFGRWIIRKIRGG